MGLAEHTVAGAEKATGEPYPSGRSVPAQGLRGSSARGLGRGPRRRGVVDSDQMFNVGAVGGKATEAATAGPKQSATRTMSPEIRLLS
jgi:hypothetical protein